MFTQALEPWKQQEIFEDFCHSVVNKQKQIVHKLLGDQFKVCGVKIFCTTDNNYQLIIKQYD